MSESTDDESGAGVVSADPNEVGTIAGGGPRSEHPKEGVEDLFAAVREAHPDRYKNQRELAAGGMGTIHRVLDTPLARTLALKVLHEHLASRPEQTEMFLREARLMGQLDHPNVVPVHDLGLDGDERVYFTMKLVDGRTLLEWIGEVRDRNFEIERDELFDLLDVIVKVCDALAFAHSRNVLHCDVKPANVMVGEFGQVYLMDWGVARLLEEERARPEDDEDPDRVVGTPSHMPPEQARGAPLDERADVFAVGALLYHVLTGRPPYRGHTHIHVLAQAFLGNCPHPDKVRGPGLVPPALSRIAIRAMAREPGDRHGSITELKNELLLFVRGGESFDAVVYEKGDVIVREGDEGDEAFIIESGRCEVRIGGESIRVMESGEVFGEMAILSPGVRTATVKALERAVLRKVSADVLNEELDNMKPWMGALVRTLAARFREREQEK